jgi:hypothetical protein
MSGASNVRFWLEAHGLKDDERVVQAVLQHAKHTKKLLSESEIRAIVAAQ